MLSCVILVGGSATYLLRDIAGALDRYQKYHFDKMLYVVEDQQKVHFAQCFKILSLLEDCPFDASDKLAHIRFGRVNGKITPLGVGNLVFLKEILDGAKETMMKQIKGNSERFATIEAPELTSMQVGLTAVKVQAMQAKRCGLILPLPRVNTLTRPPKNRALHI